MATREPEPEGRAWASLASALRQRFSLARDRASDADIDERIRGEMELRGTNLWVLMFAIVIASVGLNVNSTAVIIGAMLISPLMGPIMALGFGVGTYDLKLARAALSNLLVASVIALLVSTAYFAVTPLRSAHSELLARTAPTIWDVLVALFGGLAGIVAATRRKHSNVVPGVAIATALMPPLCAAGYGLAVGEWRYFLGAFYLFTINCVFIGASAAFVTRAFHVQRALPIDPGLQRRVHVILSVVVAATILPSLYLAYRLVGEEVFRARASAFVGQELRFPGTRVTDVGVDPQARRIEVSLIGANVDAARLAQVRQRLDAAGLSGADLRVYQAGSNEVDVASLRSGVLSDLYRESQAESAAKDATIGRLRGELEALKAGSERDRGIPAELKALYPEIDSLLIARGPQWESATGYRPGATLVLIVSSRRQLSAADRRRIELWLRARTGVADARIVVQAG